MITDNSSLQLGSYTATIVQSLGCSHGRIHRFKVRLDRLSSSHDHSDHSTGVDRSKLSNHIDLPDQPDSENSGNSGNLPSEWGLLRVGSATGLLQQELQLRTILGDYALIAPLLAHITVPNIADRLQNPSENPDTAIVNLETNTSIDADRAAAEFYPENPENTLPDATPNPDDRPSESNDYLEEEFYPEEPLPDDTGDRLLLLTALPDESQTLAHWLNTPHSLTDVLATIAQLCQVFCYFQQQHWCAIDLDPAMIEVSQPLRYFDLTSVYPAGIPLTSGLMGDYIAPEFAANPTPQSAHSTYTLGALLHRALYGGSSDPSAGLEFDQIAIPYLSQLLALCLSPIAEVRFSLLQLRTLLIENRNRFATPRVTWETASASTVGLSRQRLQNEDSYGLWQSERSDTSSQILAAVADGMGGMAAGEVASRVAIQTVFEQWQRFDDLPTEPTEPTDQRLRSVMEAANTAVTQAVQNGGTTLSVVFAEAQTLTIAHVGDSRIYLLRNAEIYQLSQDHSLVALLVASGQISEQDSQDHPDRNVLTKSLGSKKQLASGYIQISEPIHLQDGDIILLCSDGVWDCLSDADLLKQFQPANSSLNLKAAVQETIATVLYQGAPDNATLLALRCEIRLPDFIPTHLDLR
ncbi:MAG: serine/threonine-protein phosphatase [Coleofasciculaceae cyanobacterium RL_1_1]|nr:serine/threonine-protein phosphatase [Coleofasciculaceae cyanobacterium RL_1_1]